MFRSLIKAAPFLLVMAGPAAAIDFDSLGRYSPPPQRKEPATSSSYDAVDKAHRLQNKFREDDAEARRRKAEAERRYREEMANRPPPASEPETAKASTARAPDPPKDRDRVYACYVYCDNKSGTTTAKVTARDEYEAARIVDGQADEICQASEFRRATSHRMSASQCRRQ